MTAARARKAPHRRKAGATAGGARAVPRVDAIMAFVDNAPTAVAMTDRELRFLKASPVWLADFGMSEAELIGRTSYELAPETREKYQELHQKCLAGEAVSSAPERVVVPNGAERWMMWDATPWRGDDGAIGGLLITSRDVTPQKEVEEELRRTRAFLSSILENVPAPLIVKDAESRVLIMNRAMEELYGQPREEQIGKRLEDLHNPELVARIAREDQEVLASQAPLIVENLQMNTLHKGQRDVRKTKVAIRDGDGPAYILSITEDVTERMRTQRELESTRAFLTAILENAPLPMVVNDEDGRVLMMNRAMEGLYGVRSQDHVGRTVAELLAPEAARKVMAENAAAFASGGTSLIEETTLIPARGEERVLLKTKAAIPSGDGRRLMLSIIEDITERKKTQEELENTRAFLSTVIESVPIPLVLKSAVDGRIVMTNRANQDLHGAPIEEILGKTAEELFDPSEVARMREEDGRVVRSGQLHVNEDVPITTRRNGLRRIRQMKMPIRAPDGSPYILAISEDITERRRAADELERTRNFLETVIDNVPAGITVKDASTNRVLMANPASRSIYGFRSAGESIGTRNEDVFPPDLAARFSEQDREIIETGGSRRYEEEPVQTPRGLRYMNRSKVLIRNNDGPDYLLSITEDVTDRKTAAEELLRTRAFLQTVIDNVPAGLTVKDATDGRLLIMNPALEDIYGVVHGQNLGKTGDDVFPAEQAARFAAQDRQVIESGQMTTFEEDPVWTARGLRHLNRRKVLIRNEEGPDYLLSISEDVTDRKIAKDALKEALARAEAANIAKSEFLANMSHEIRTPLNGVLGLADALSRMDLTDQQRDIVAMIVGSGKALTGILSDVLDLAKAEAGQLQLQTETFSLRETIGQAAFLFETVARDKGVAFKVTFDANAPDRLLGDPLRIKQVVSNLISNAVKFTTKGTVSIRATAVPDAAGHAALKITVKDTGPGFTQEVRDKLFSRFQQGDGSITSKFGGTGLGLSIANALAHMMDGEISCNATPGAGATFVFRARLKIAEAAAAGSLDDARRASERAAQERPLRILLAEDHEVNQKVVQLMLGAAADLVITSDGQQALDAFNAQPPFDLILMDTQMPVMDGLTAIQRIREIEAQSGRRRTPIVSLTANAMAHQVQAALACGADVHLAKPITSDGLYAAIDQALGDTDAADRPESQVA